MSGTAPDFGGLLSFLGIALLVLATPGPSLILIAAASLAGGRRAGLVAVAGTNAGLALVVIAVVAGVGSLVAAYAPAFAWLRWAGVLWLAIAGLANLLQPMRASEPPVRPAGFWRAFAVSSLNPATTPFLVALLPQFIDPGRPAWPQLALLACAFLLLAMVVDIACALTVARVSGAWTGSVTGRRRTMGALLLVAAILLAKARA